MTPSPSSADPPLLPANIYTTPPALPAIIEWKADDGQSHYIGRSPNLAHLFFEYDAPTKTGSFKLSVAFMWHKIGTRVQNRRSAPLYLCLHLNEIRCMSLNMSCPLPPDEFLEPLGRDLACVSVDMTSSPVLCAPDWPLTPQNVSHKTVLDSVTRLAQLNSFNVYVQRGPTLATEDLRSLCTAVASSEAWLDDASWDVAGLYDNGRGKIIGLDLLAPGVTSPDTTRLPPAYHDLEPQPPMAPLVSPTKRRRRTASGGSPDETTPGDELALIRDRMELLEQRLAKAEGERGSDRGRIEELEKQVQVLLDQKGQVEEVQDDLEALQTRIDDRVWVEVDDLRTTVRSDFDDLQHELRGSVAQLVQDALDDAVESGSVVELVQNALEDTIQSQLADSRIRVRDVTLELYHNDE